MTNEKRLRGHRLFTLENKRLREDLTAVYRHLITKFFEVWLSEAHSDRTRSSKFRTSDRTSWNMANSD